VTAVTSRPSSSSLRAFAAQQLSRAAGAPLVEGNLVKILRDARENFPAWMEAINSAERLIYFECYIISDDETGRRFAEALAAKARAGVKVRLLYDWIGCWRESGSRYYRALREAGVEIRCYNPPKFDSPFGWLSRDHRKMLAVDGRVGFVTGLCLSARWEGDPARGIEPWRDTGVQLEGPALADLETAFAEVWAATGDPIPPGEFTPPASMEMRGGVALRVIPTAPATTAVYRLDLVMSSIARKTLWLTDAYFVGIPPYVQALCQASRDGVDVRLLVPGGSDVPLVSPLSRSGYRPLLEAGVRVFEWNGTMLHAKTAVVDGLWARVGSTNLNLQSWLGNYELDVAVEDAGFAQQMEAIYIEDLSRATEIVLSKHSKVRRIAHPEGGRSRRPLRLRDGSSGRAATSAVRWANSVGAALTSRRELGPAESHLMLGAGILLTVVAVVALLWPLLLTIPIAVLAAWVGLASLLRAWRLGRERVASLASPAPLRGATEPAAERLP
jgi:cardiolipin synthase